MSTRFEFPLIDSSVQGWDADMNDALQTLKENPWPISEMSDTFDETDLETQFPAAAHRNSLIWVYTTGLEWVLYFSDGTTWATWSSTFSQAINSGVAATTMSGNQTLTSSSQPIQFDDPNGGNRTVTLDATNHTFGRQLTVVHTGIANTLQIKDSGGGTLTTLSHGQTGIFTRDVSTWRIRTTTAATSPSITTPSFFGDINTDISKVFFGGVDLSGIWNFFSNTTPANGISMQVSAVTSGGALINLVCGPVTGNVYGMLMSLNCTSMASMTLQQNGNGSAAFESLVLGTGDPVFRSTVNGGVTWEWGQDQSDGGKWKLSNGSPLGSGNDFIVVTTTGHVSFGGPIRPKTYDNTTEGAETFTNGDIWYNSQTDKIRAQTAGGKVDLN